MQGDFNDMWNAIISLFSITVGLYQGDFREIQPDPMLLTMIYLFLLVSVVLLLNLLIAQLNQTYEYINKERYCQLATLFFFMFSYTIYSAVSQRGLVAADLALKGMGREQTLV